MAEGKPARDRLGTLLWRLVMLLMVWGLALHFTVRAVSAFTEHHRISRALATATSEYNDKFRDYSNQLWEGERLANDRDYQRKMLKDSYYYFERDEQPIVIVDE